jgi:hypothetical protein
MPSDTGLRIDSSVAISSDKPCRIQRLLGIL